MAFFSGPKAIDEANRRATNPQGYAEELQARQQAAYYANEAQNRAALVTIAALTNSRSQFSQPTGPVFNNGNPQVPGNPQAGPEGPQGPAAPQVAAGPANRPPLGPLTNPNSNQPVNNHRNHRDPAFYI